MRINKGMNLWMLMLLVVGISCKGQPTTRAETIHVDEFKWTVTIPENFESISEEEWDQTEKRGEEMMEQTFGEDIINQAVTLFSYKSGKFNNFEANWQPYDEDIDGDYLTLNAEVNEMLYQTFVDQMPKAKVDSLSSTQTISGLEFHRFDITIDFLNGIEMKTIGFSRLFGEKEFTVNISYVEKSEGKKMLKAFMNSIFK